MFTSIAVCPMRYLLSPFGIIGFIGLYWLFKCSSLILIYLPTSLPALRHVMSFIDMMCITSIPQLNLDVRNNNSPESLLIPDELMLRSYDHHQL